MSGRMSRVKETLANVLGLVKADAEKTRHPYVVGFHNGLALADHHINMRTGTEPPFLDLVPAPNRAGDEQEYEFLVDKVITAARKAQGCDELSSALADLDAFVGAKLEKAGQGELFSAPDAGEEKQEGSSPSPAASSSEEPHHA